MWLLRSLYFLFLTHSLFVYTALALPTISTDQPSSLLSIHHHPIQPDPLHPLTHPKRAITSHYNGLGPYKMSLTASSLLLTPALPAPLSPSIKTLTNLFTSVATQAAAHAASNAPAITTVAEFGQGSVTLAFLLRGKGNGKASISWQLVELLAQQFLRRAQMGNPSAFRGVVSGPFGGDGMGGVPWVEVVLTVGGKAVVEGVEWGIF
ncbi:hypothetical protein ACLMJK_007466 [Lecanora helva]